jgi:hypothetical protein
MTRQHLNPTDVWHSLMMSTPGGIHREKTGLTKPRPHIHGIHGYAPTSEHPRPRNWWSGRQWQCVSSPARRTMNQERGLRCTRQGDLPLLCPGLWIPNSEISCFGRSHRKLLIGCHESFPKRQCHSMQEAVSKSQTDMDPPFDATNSLLRLTNFNDIIGAGVSSTILDL